MESDYNWDTFYSEYSDLLKDCSLEVGDGWLTLIRDMCKEVKYCVSKDEISPFVQIKSKFGGLRVYTMDYNENMNKIIRKYEGLSLETCESCGSPGTRKGRGYWVTTLCDICFVHSI
jgi:hypothetical protein